MCTRIKYFTSSLQSATKNFQIRTGGTKSANVGAKRKVGPTFVRTESLLSRAILKMFLGLFIGDDM